MHGHAATVAGRTHAKPHAACRPTCLLPAAQHAATVAERTHAKPHATCRPTCCYRPSMLRWWHHRARRPCTTGQGMRTRQGTHAPAKHAPRTPAHAYLCPQHVLTCACGPLLRQCNVPGGLGCGAGPKNKLSPFFVLRSSTPRHLSVIPKLGVRYLQHLGDKIIPPDAIDLIRHECILPKLFFIPFLSRGK